MALLRLCANVDPEIPPPITRQSYCASEEAWRHDDDVAAVAVGVDIMDVGGANASVFDMHRPPINSEDLTIFFFVILSLFLLPSIALVAVCSPHIRLASIFSLRVLLVCFFVEVVSAQQIAL